MIGRWLSELPMDDPTHKSFSKPLLRRFIHHDKPITRLGRISLGTEGIVLLVEIEGVEYVMKLVGIISTLICYITSIRSVTS